jgi:hypothetical protein
MYNIRNEISITLDDSIRSPPISMLGIDNVAFWKEVVGTTREIRTWGDKKSPAWNCALGSLPAVSTRDG